MDETLAINGRRVSENFNAWFGSGVVVNERGEPRIVFHGSRSPFLERFDKTMQGTGVVNGHGSGWDGFWFTSNRDNAHFFANPVGKVYADGNNLMPYGHLRQHYVAIVDGEGEGLFQVGPFRTAKLAEEAADRAIVRYNTDPHRGEAVFDLYLALKNPLVIDGLIPRQREFTQARRDGHDGIVALNVADGSHFGDVYVAFDPASIKSATHNCGLYVQGSSSLDDGDAAEEIKKALLVKERVITLAQFELSKARKAFS